MDAFDADVLICAAATGDPIGAPIRRLYAGSATTTVGLGSRLLEGETLIKPVRLGALDELAELRRLLARLELYDVTAPISDLAIDLGAKYGLRTPDAVHLATAVIVGADRFITNNRRDFVKEIAEVDVTYPDELPVTCAEPAADLPAPGGPGRVPRRNVQTAQGASAAPRAVRVSGTTR